MRQLFIVESPAKSKIIKKYLDCIDPANTHIVKACFGHIRDLKHNELGIDLEKDFLADWYVVESKVKIVKELKDEVLKADAVYLASDNDREGESIAWHLYEVLKPMNKRLKNGESCNKKFKRIVFNEITKHCLQTALENTRDIDMNLVHAQQARRLIDRIVGFKISPLLWKRFTTVEQIRLSAGRVQSATLKLIIDKENDVTNHVSEQYWTTQGNFSFIEGFRLETVKLYNKDGLSKQGKLPLAMLLLNRLHNKFTVTSSENRLVKQKPDPPFITSSLQQEAYNKMGVGASKAMKLAQDLYEDGLITYMRTDSYNIAEEAQQMIKRFISEVHGIEYVQLSGSKCMRGKVKGAQEAHEAIRPTDVHVDSMEVHKRHSVQHAKLYELVWNRAVASLCKDAEYEELVVKIIDSSFSNDMFMEGKEKVLKFLGWKIVYGDKIGNVKHLHELMRQSKTKHIECEHMEAHSIWTSAPQRFNESMLIKTLETAGIGRPSTYAGILEKLFEKQYVIQQDTPNVEHLAIDLKWKPQKNVSQIEATKTIVGEKKRIVPTDIGEQINKYMESTFNDIVNSQFTSNMEADLDDVALGRGSMKDVINKIWEPLKQKITSELQMKKEKIKVEASRNVFTVNGCKAIVRLGKYGPVIEVSSDMVKHFIDLKQFLSITNIGYHDVSEAHVQFLMNLPSHIGNNKFALNIGKFGLYVTKAGDVKDSVSLEHSWIKKNGGVIEMINLTEEQVVRLFDDKKKYLNKKQ
jgi:DNA topoisomerase-1